MCTRPRPDAGRPVSVPVVVADSSAEGALSELGVLDRALLDVWAVGVEVLICAGVEVEETNGRALLIYEPFAWTAYSPTSRSPLGVSY